MDYFDEDIRLMQKFQDGEESSFEQLVERHKDRVFNLAYKFLGNYEQAKDLAQEIFIKIYHAKKTYKPKAKFTTWLYAIAKNTCLKELRKKIPSAVSIDEDLQLDGDTVGRQIADAHSVSPAASMLDNEKKAMVKQAIDSLPPNQKMAVILHRYEQLAYEEIAQIMGHSTKAVKSLLHRARENLKERLADYFKA